MGDISFAIKYEGNGVVREVKDVTGILHKSMELFMKPFEYLFNSEYISAQQKAELRQQVIDQGILPPVQVQGQGTDKGIKLPNGTYV